MNEYQAMRDELAKLAFTVSQYSGPLSYGRFPLVSSMPDPGSAGGLQAALTSRTAKQMRGEPVEKIGAYRPGLVTTDMAQNMAPDDAALVHERVPWHGRLRPGVLPIAAMGAYGGAWGWPNLVGAIGQKTLAPKVSAKTRLIGGALGAASAPVLEHLLHDRRDTSGDEAKLLREARVREMLASVDDAKTADISPASPWSGGMYYGARQPSSLPDPTQAGAMQAELTRRVIERLEKRGYSPQTPAGRLARTKSVGAPNMSAPPGPSIAQVAKPVGAKFGGPIAGAKKGTI